MFNGHLDIEPVSPAYADLGKEPFSRRVAGGHIYGIGTMNMRTAVAAYFGAVDALLETGFEPIGHHHRRRPSRVEWRRRDPL
ncbi:MAG: M20/M25/M40 family metallo-hydrolase, partial [Candidatus Dormibacteraceae bacterium]